MEVGIFKDEVKKVFASPASNESFASPHGEEHYSYERESFHTHILTVAEVWCAPRTIDVEREKRVLSCVSLS